MNKSISFITTWIDVFTTTFLPQRLNIVCIKFKIIYKNAVFQELERISSLRRDA